MNVAFFWSRCRTFQWLFYRLTHISLIVIGFLSLILFLVAFLSLRMNLNHKLLFSLKLNILYVYVYDRSH